MLELAVFFSCLVQAVTELFLVTQKDSYNLCYNLKNTILVFLILSCEHPYSQEKGVDQEAEAALRGREVEAGTKRCPLTAFPVF